MSRQIVALTLAAGLVAAPTLAFAQADGTPGNPAGTAASRAIDRAAGQPTIPDGAPGNPPGTAVGRAVDRATGQPTSPDGTGNNPPGTALDRAAERVGQAVTPSGTAPAPAARAPAAMPATTSTAAIVSPRPRMSQVIGARVYNAEGETIGSVEDVMLGSAANNAMAIIQVGGFLGLGGRLVAVPLAELQWNAERERIMLPGATKDELRARPEFSFPDTRRS
jgi:hypothetical protein